MLLTRKFGSVLALVTLLVAIAGAFCPASAQQMNAKQMACCASKPCQHAGKLENCCSHMSVDQQQFSAEFSQLLPDLHLVLATPGALFLPVVYESSTLVETAEVEHAPPVPLYTIHRSFLI